MSASQAPSPQCHRGGGVAKIGAPVIRKIPSPHTAWQLAA